MLDPDPPEHVDSGQFTQPAGSVLAIDRREQGEAVGTDGQGVLGAGRVADRQPEGVHLPLVAIEPLPGRESSQPLQDGHRQRLQSSPHRLGDQLQPVQGPARGQHPGPVGPRAATTAEQPGLPQTGQQEIQ